LVINLLTALVETSTYWDYELSCVSSFLVYSILWILYLSEYSSKMFVIDLLPQPNQQPKTT
jgi:hypothetical protein